MFKFLTRRHLIWNMLVGILITAGLVTAVFYSLDAYTKHGKTNKVPNVIGKTFADAKSLLNQSKLVAIIQDSVYIDSLPPGTVLKQTPEANETVKLNRTVYLIVNNMVPPMVEIPNIYGYAKSLAFEALLNRGFKIGDTTYRNDFTPNSILEVKCNNIKLEKGTKVPKGSKIDLLISSGPGTTKFDVPDLFGMKLSDAKTLLDSLALQPSAIMVMAGETIKDSANAYIYKQSPPRYDAYSHTISKIVAGSGIDIWLSNAKPPESSRVDTTNFNMLPIADPNAVYKVDPEMQGLDAADNKAKIPKRTKPKIPKLKKVIEPAAPPVLLPKNPKTD